MKIDHAIYIIVYTLLFKSWYIDILVHWKMRCVQAQHFFLDKTVWATVDSSEIQQTSHHLSVSFWKPAIFLEHFPTTKWFAVFHKPGVKKNPIPGVNQNPPVFSTITCWWFRNPATSWGTGTVVYPIVCRIFIHSRWLALGFLNHQQYHGKNTKQYQGWQQKP